LGLCWQGWGANSAASPSWMRIKGRETPIERKPYMTSPFKNQTCLYVELAGEVPLMLTTCVRASRRSVAPDVEHRSRPTWSQAPVVPSPTALAVTQYADVVKPGHADLLSSKSAAFFDTTNGTSLSNPFLNATSSPKSKYKTKSYGSPKASSSPSQFSMTGAREDPGSPTAVPFRLEDTSRRAVTPSPLHRTKSMGASLRSPFSPAASEVVRVTTPGSRRDLFTPTSSSGCPF
jgi:hypothetical protein